MISSIVRELYEGDVAAFIRYTVFLDDNLNRILEQQLERISSEEQDIMYWLAVKQEPLSLEDLKREHPFPSLRIRIAENCQLSQATLVSRNSTQ